MISSPENTIISTNMKHMKRSNFDYIYHIRHIIPIVCAYRTLIRNQISDNHVINSILVSGTIMSVAYTHRCIMSWGLCFGSMF